MVGAFEPPKYIDALIKAINEGAKAAQAGLLFLTLVALYLLATSFATTDEDLLLNHTTVISQVGVTVPVLASFVVAPLVFLGLHAFTLIRYDMLAANLRHFNTELEAAVPKRADRERCRQLLANVEFVQALTAPPGSPLRSRFFGPAAAVMLAVVPLVVLLALQIGTLRYQSGVIINIQRAAVFADLALLGWFVSRFVAKAPPANGAASRLRAFAGLLLAGTAAVWVTIFDLRYLNMPDPDDAADVQTVEQGRDRPSATPVWRVALDRQPLDLLLCPQLRWGCRFITADHRTLIAKVWDDKAIPTLRLGTGDGLEAAHKAIEAVRLNDRSLRFADFRSSLLFDAVFAGADLRHASLQFASLQGASLFNASLQGASLYHASLQGVSLFNASLQGAFLFRASLQGASLYSASLQGASLDFASLQGASLDSASLQGASLDDASLQGASLDHASLQGVQMFGALVWRGGAP